MKWLLDTNVISELSRPKPDRNVTAWLAKQDQDDLALSIVSAAEMRLGISLLPDGARRRHFEIWFEESVRPMFFGRTLEITEDVALLWLGLIDQMKRKQKTLPTSDSLIAATALHNGLTVCSRDTKPYLQCEVPLFNPFTGERFNGA